MGKTTTPERCAAAPGARTTEPTRKIAPAADSRQSELLRAAEWYSSHGIPTVIVSGKVTLPPRGVHAATADLTLWRGWLQKYGSCRDLGLGLATGHQLRCGRYLAVLDVDVKGGAGGDVSLAEVEGLSGEPVPETWTVRTPSTGLHYLLRTSEPVGNRVAFRPGLDVRGKGGYVVAPPSPGYRIERRAAIADAPSWFMEEMRPKPRPARPTGPIGAVPHGEIGSRYVETAIERECAEVASAPEGCRNDALNRGAFALARFVADGQADAAGVVRALTIAAVFCGLREQEIEKTITSAFRAREVAL